MALKKVPKQNYESFPVVASFTQDMEESETIESQTVDITDSSGVDTSNEMLSNILNNGEHDVQATVSDGDEASSPYKMTYRIVTSSGNRWEYDLSVIVKEL